MRAMWISAANSVWGAPNPRKAPHGTVLVMTARARTRTFAQRYGPVACSAPRDRTTGESVDVRAGVHHDLDVLGHQAAVRGDARAVADHRRVPLRRRRDVLVPVVGHAHRAPGRAREQRGVDGQHGRVLLLAAEAAAGLGLDDADLRDRERERAGEGGMDVVRALQRARDGDAAVRGRDGDHRLGLDVDVLLGPHPVLALDHQVGLAEPGVEVAPGDLVAGERLLGSEEVQDGRQRLGAQVDRGAGRARRRRVGRRDQGHGLGVVPDLVGDEGRLVVVHQVDDVLAGDVGSRDDHDPRPVEGRVAVDAQEARAGLGRPDGQPVPGAVDVRGRRCSARRPSPWPGRRGGARRCRSGRSSRGRCATAAARVKRQTAPARGLSGRCGRGRAPGGRRRDVRAARCQGQRDVRAARRPGCRAAGRRATGRPGRSAAT